MVTMEIGKTQFLSYHNSELLRGKKLHQNLESYRFKRPLKRLFYRINAKLDKILQPQKGNVLETGRKS